MSLQEVFVTWYYPPIIKNCYLIFITPLVYPLGEHVNRQHLSGSQLWSSYQSIDANILQISNPFSGIPAGVFNKNGKKLNVHQYWVSPSSRGQQQQGDRGVVE